MSSSAAIEAKGYLSDGDLATARRFAKNSLTGPTRAHAYPNYVAAAVEKSAEAAAPALAAYETALGGPEPAGAIYIEASALYLDTGQRDKAVEVIETGYARLQESPSLTVPLSAVAPVETCSSETKETTACSARAATTGFSATRAGIGSMAETAGTPAYRGNGAAMRRQAGVEQADVGRTAQGSTQAAVSAGEQLPVQLGRL